MEGRAGLNGEASMPPPWVATSASLARAYRLAAEAHAGQLRPSDGAPFLDHVVEVAVSLHDARYDEDLIAAGLLHDSVERGTLSEERLRATVAEPVCELVLALTEDASIDSFADRKAALRGQVNAAGERAMTIFAADKLSDIRGLRQGIDRFGDGLEARIGTTVDAMAGHYEESVAMIEEAQPGLGFVGALRAELQTVRGLSHSRG
jgi:hypothetical protein